MQFILSFLLPNGRRVSPQGWLFFSFQILVIAGLSIGKVLRGGYSENPWFVFGVSFIIYFWVFRILVGLIEWLADYLKEMTISTVCVIILPIVILMGFRWINTWVEKEVCFILLILSVMGAYIELFHFITWSTTVSKSKMTKALKVKSIITWLFIILLNFYAVLILVQFKSNPEIRHFIQATTLNETSAIDLLYYLLITFSTVGFGDICPHTELAKLLTGMIALSGMLFSGMFIATILAVDEREEYKKKEAKEK